MRDGRVDFAVIADLVEPGSRVLDVGCEDGELLALLEAEKNVDGRGVELAMQNVSRAVGRGLAVVQGDADRDLVDYPDNAFDYVILSQTLQATRNPRTVLTELVRIGQRAIVSFPNFGYWRVRLSLLLLGRMPVNETLPHQWYDTPNIHFCTIRDFVALCRELDVRIVKATALNGFGQARALSASWRFWNLFGEQAVFLLEPGDAQRR